MFNLLEDVTLEQVTHNFTLAQAGNRKASFIYIAAGALVALKVNNLLDAKDKLAKLFDTKVSKEADFRLAALRMVKHHRVELLTITEQASDLEQATNLLADYISNHYANDTGAVYGKLNGKVVCLPRLSLLDVKKDKVEREADATSKQEHEQEAALATLPDDLTPIDAVCNGKKVNVTIATIAKMLAENVEQTHLWQEELCYQLGVITGAVSANETELEPLLVVARGDFAKVVERNVKRALQAA